MNEYEIDAQGNRDKAIEVWRRIKERVSADRDYVKCLLTMPENIFAMEAALENGWDIPSKVLAREMRCPCCKKRHHKLRLVEDFLSLHWEGGRCPVCEDRHRREFDQKIHDDYCNSVFLAGGIPSRLLSARWTDIHPSHRKVMEAADLKDHLWICGPNRVGKSYAAVALLRKMCMAGWAIRVEKFSVLTSLGIEDAMKRFGDVRIFEGVLLLDDVTKITSDFWADKFEDLVTYRYDNLLSTIYTTNFLPEEFPELFGSRLVSRILEQGSQVVFNKAKFQEKTGGL